MVLPVSAIRRFRAESETVRTNRRTAILGSAAFALAVTSGALAAAPSRKRRTPAAPPPPIGDEERVEIVTELGTIVALIDVKRAPVTGTNFIRYVDQKRLDGTTFYRAMRLAWGEQPNGLVQAGTRGDPRRTLPPIAHEPTSLTGIRHKAGTLSMARFAPGTATGDFSIMVSDQPGLDADPAASDAELQAGYAAFGQVVSGMEVVRLIFDAPVSLTTGEGALRGQMLAKPVRILTARRIIAPK